MNSRTAITRRTLVKQLAGAGLAATVGLPARAQSDRPITLVVGFSAGGGSDAVARLIAPHMSQRLGRPVVVNNMAGASGNIGTQHVVNAKPDGSTLLLSSMTQIVVSPSTFGKLPFDPINGLTHICMMAQSDFVVAVNSALPVNTAAELVEFSKRHPGSVNFGTAGPGTVIHVMCELFKQRTGADILAVHYKGSGQMIGDLLGGTIHGCVDGLQSVEQYARQGKLRLLAIAAEKRNALIPNVPTAAEAGIKDFGSTSNWFGLHAPAGVPAALADEIYDAARFAASRPEIKERLAALGLDQMTDKRAEFSGLIASQKKLFAEVVKRGNIQAG